MANAFTAKLCDKVKKQLLLHSKIAEADSQIVHTGCFDGCREAQDGVQRGGKSANFLIKSEAAAQMPATCQEERPCSIEQANSLAKPTAFATLIMPLAVCSHAARCQAAAGSRWLQADLQG